MREQKRLNDAREAGIPWKKWGPYLSERQWGTVREDYSEDGDAWNYFTHDQSRSRAYRWGEDGLGGICDDKQRLCFALALWNERDPILKERLFGLTNSEGNHGEDVKEYYFYLDSTPTHSYMKYLYKYPQREFPYRDLVETNRRRSREEFEYELLDTGVFDDDRYFDVFVEYAKEGPEDVLIRITVHNRGPEVGPAASVADTMVSQHLVLGRGRSQALCCAKRGPAPFRPHTMSWASTGSIAMVPRNCSSPKMRTMRNVSGASPTLLPTSRMRSTPTSISGKREAVNPAKTGTKAAAHYIARRARRRQQNGPAAADGHRRQTIPSAVSRRYSTAGSPMPTNSTSGSRPTR